MTRQNKSKVQSSDVARRNNHKYCRRHGFGETIQIVATVENIYISYVLQVLGLAPRHSHAYDVQNNEYDSLCSDEFKPIAGTFSSPMLSGLRWPGQTVMGSWPPALGLKKGEDRRKRKREVLHLFRCYTHTHTPGQSRVNPERQEEEKSGHTTGRRPKTAQGGEGNRRTSGTNLHGETDLTKTAHTPQPHDALRRGTRGKLGTKWGTS